MAVDEHDTWQVMYSEFLGADFESDINFYLNNDLEALDNWKVYIVMTKNEQWKQPCVTLGDFDLRATVADS